MNIFEEAVIYATIMHQGRLRKGKGTPYILHPLEVAQILSTLTDDLEVITAGVLHDIVEDTDGTIGEIRARFGERVASLVESETEHDFPGKTKDETWEARKAESLTVLANAKDFGVKQLWLADKLSNIRSVASIYSEKGNSIWELFHQKDPERHHWYYKSIAEILEMDLNKTGAFKEFIKHINFIWPNTFDEEKTKYKKYREYDVSNCKIIGRGAKSVVYRYDDELVIKVYNEKNTYKEIERENFIARKAFIFGIPTAISFGIVSVGEHYGSMFELLNSDTVSGKISQNPADVDKYAHLMADLALKIHTTECPDDSLPEYIQNVYSWVSGGIAHEDMKLASEISKMLEALPKRKTMIHGDFHTGNVMLQNDEAFLIDLDRLSICHPIVELCGLYMFYVGFGELDPAFVESFMEFSYKTANIFFERFMHYYLQTDDEKRIQEVVDKAALLCYVRLVRRCYKKGTELSEADAKARDYYMKKIYELKPKVDSFDF